jgi:hypothetical protein
MSELAISSASRSHHGGLLDHFGFEVASSKSYPVNGGYDLVHLFRRLHEMGDPVGARRICCPL